jgi:hypothetical protein
MQKSSELMPVTLGEASSLDDWCPPLSLPPLLPKYQQPTPAFALVVDALPLPRLHLAKLKARDDHPARAVPEAAAAQTPALLFRLVRNAVEEPAWSRLLDRDITSVAGSCREPSRKHHEQSWSASELLRRVVDPWRGHSCHAARPLGDGTSPRSRDALPPCCVRSVPFNGSLGWPAGGTGSLQAALNVAARCWEPKKENANFRNQLQLPELELSKRSSSRHSALGFAFDAVQERIVGF